MCPFHKYIVMGYLKQKFREVTLKDGRRIKVLPEEVSILQEAGKLGSGKLGSGKRKRAPAKRKEDKSKTETKEEKDTGDTKNDPKAARERMYPTSKRPVNISYANIKGFTPKKV